MFRTAFDTVKTMKLRHLLVISLVLSELLTAIMDVIMGRLWWGSINRDLMIIGSIDAFVVAFIVSIVLILLFREIKNSEQRSHESVRQAKAEWERTFDSMSDLIMILDANHRVVKVNRPMADKLNMTPSEAVGITCYEYVHGHNAPAPTCPHSMTMADGKEHSVEVYEEKLGGFYMVSVTPLFNDRGEVTGSVHTAKDISERKRAELALRDNEKKFRTLFESATDAIFIVDMAGNLIDVNRTAHERLGYSKHEMLAMSLSTLDTTEFAGSVPARMEQLREHGQAVFESAHRRKDGAVMPVEINTRVIDFEGKKAMLGIIRDITKRKHAEIALREAAKEKDDLIVHLQQALATIKTLHGILPICSACKNIRDDKGYWNQLESYIQQHSEAEFSHGICPDCAAKLYPEHYRGEKY